MRSEVREVWFIRHGESLANAGVRTKEAPTYPLTDLGFAQAEKYAAALEVTPDLVITSPYVRARQTAEPTRRRHPHIACEEWPVQEVQYLDPALCVDTTQDERRELSHAYWRESDPHFAAPDAESFVAFITRARHAVDRLSRRHERRIFIFSHGQFMSAVAWLILSRPAAIDSAAMRRFYQFLHSYAVPNCSVLPLYFHPEGAHSLGGLWLPEGMESVRPLEAGLAGV